MAFRTISPLHVGSFRYPNKPPGPSLLAVPVYAVCKLFDWMSLRAVTWAFRVTVVTIPSLVVAALIVLLALVEGVNAIVAPARAPSERDWVAAAAEVRKGFRPGDLIVASPAWADPLMRVQLGDLVPVSVAGRMDAARYGRIWEISQRGARAADTAGAKGAESSRHGALTVKRWEKQPATVTFDFLTEWRRASVSVVNADGTEVPCALGPHRWQCVRGVSLGPELLEIDATLRNGLGVEPVEGLTLVLEYENVPLADELVVATGLHNVWLRKSGDGKVKMRVLLAGHETGTLEATSASGWSLRRFDTSPILKTSVSCRFKITVDKAHARHFGFAAEARNP